MSKINILLIILISILTIYWFVFKTQYFSETFTKTNWVKKIKNHVIHIGLVVVLIVLTLYIFSIKFKFLLVSQGIDPSFLMGFFTVLALFLSLIQNSNDKKYTYNLKLVESIEDKGLRVIGKLLNIKQKSSVLLGNLKMYQKALNENIIVRDSNGTLSTESINNDMESISSYIDTYFPEQATIWNNVMDELTVIGTHNANITINYSENIDLIKKEEKFNNLELDNIDKYVVEAEKTNKKIENMTFKIRQGIVTKVNETKSKLKDNFNFQL